MAVPAVELFDGGKFLEAAFLPHTRTGILGAFASAIRSPRF
jgi:hypothetical protein